MDGTMQPCESSSFAFLFRTTVFLLEVFSKNDLVGKSSDFPFAF